jgi:hypothetical protein
MRYLLAILLAFLLVGACKSTDPNYFRQVEANPKWWQQKKDSLERVISKRRDSLKRALGEDPVIYKGPVQYTANRKFAPPYTPEAAFDILLNTVAFKSSFVGISGSPSDQAIAFNLVLDSPNPEKAFRDLYKRANPAGKLYAISGLYFTDRSLFKEKVDEMAQSQDSVWMQKGDVFGWEKVGHIVRHPDGIRLETDQSIKEWYREEYGSNWRLAEPGENNVFDIAGGTWPKEFRRVREHVHY